MNTTLDGKIAKSVSYVQLVNVIKKDIIDILWEMHDLNFGKKIPSSEKDLVFIKYKVGNYLIDLRCREAIKDYSVDIDMRESENNIVVWIQLDNTIDSQVKLSFNITSMKINYD